MAKMVQIWSAQKDDAKLEKLARRMIGFENPKLQPLHQINLKAGKKPDKGLYYHTVKVQYSKLPSI